MPKYIVYGSYKVLFDWSYTRDTKDEMLKLVKERLQKIVEKGNIAEPEITEIVEEKDNDSRFKEEETG